MGAATHKAGHVVARDATRFGTGVAIELRRRRFVWGIWPTILVAGLVIATALGALLSRVPQVASATAWIYLPLVLLVTLHWARVHGLFLGSTLTVLLFAGMHSYLGLALAAGGIVGLAYWWTR